MGWWGCMYIYLYPRDEVCTYRVWLGICIAIIRDEIRDRGAYLRYRRPESCRGKSRNRIPSYVEWRYNTRVLYIYICFDSCLQLVGMDVYSHLAPTFSSLDSTPCSHPSIIYLLYIYPIYYYIPRYLVQPIYTHAISLPSFFSFSFRLTAQHRSRASIRVDHDTCGL